MKFGRGKGRRGKSRRRIAGFSFPSFFGFGGGGVTLQEKEGDRDVLVKLAREIGGRRALTDPVMEEREDLVYASVREIREMLTAALKELDEDSAAAAPLERLREQVNRYLTAAENARGARDQWELVRQLLLELRRDFRATLETLADEYELAVARQLAERISKELRWGMSGPQRVIYVAPRSGDRTPSADAQLQPVRWELPEPLVRELPLDLTDFVGRDEQQARLRDALTGGVRAVAISAVAGMAGVGKSALAVHVAHALENSFPGGTLYYDLRGHEGQAVNPHTALVEFLTALGVPKGTAPRSVSRAAAAYRSRLAARRALVLLDNARDAEHVRDLLPDPPSAAIVTSRAVLEGLPSAHSIELGVFDEDTALELVARILGSERTRAEPDAVRELVRLCGCLPLALRVAATRLATRPEWAVRDVVELLRDERRRLDRLQLGDLAVRASFELSYRELPSDEARLFRLCGLFSSGEIAVDALAAAAGEDADDVEDGLERLADLHMLEPMARSWYRIHDLMRVFAAEHLLEAEPVHAEVARKALVTWSRDTLRQRTTEADS